MGQKFNYRFLAAMLLAILMSVNVMAQDMIQVQGNVKDATGEPIISATVMQKGTGNGTVTDLDGNFTLRAPKGSLIVVSYIGYKNKEVKAASNVIVVLEEDVNLLEETVVIGYAKVKKSDATGSVTAIKPDDMSKGITTTAQDMLLGKVAGVSVTSDGGTPGGSSTIRIRGGSSLTANNDPLYVIDGLAMDNNGVKGLANGFAMVNPADIETFTILKDASATAIYGSRASNGVIIITTKKGRQGSKPKVTYNGYLSFGKVSKKYDVMTGDEFRNYVKNVLGQEGNGLGTANTDWQDLIYRTAISTDHQISITGATKNMPYRVSLGYTDEQGIVKTSSFERFTAALNLSPSLFNQHLNINLSAKYMYSHSRYADGGVFGAAIEADPTQSVYSDINEFGGYWQTAIRAGFSDPNWINTTNTNTPQNPLALLELKNDRAGSSSAIGNIEFDYKVHGFEDLHIHANVGGDYSEGRQLTTISPYSYSNNFYGWDGAQQSYKYNLQGNIYAQYIKEFGVNNIDILVAAEEQHFHRSEYSEGQGWDPVLKEAKSPQTRKETEHIYLNTLVSYFGRLNYTLLDRYLLTATMRFDGSSRFSKDNRWGQFPAVGLAWKISEEKFLRNVTALDELKLRLGWGITGQQNIGYDFYYLPRYVTSNQYAQYTIGDKTYYTIRPEVYNKILHLRQIA